MKKSSLILSVALIAAMILSSCGGNGSKEEASIQDSASTEEVSSIEEATIGGAEKETEAEAEKETEAEKEVIVKTPYTSSTCFNPKYDRPFTSFVFVKSYTGETEGRSYKYSLKGDSRKMSMDFGLPTFTTYSESGYATSITSSPDGKILYEGLSSSKFFYFFITYGTEDNGNTGPLITLTAISHNTKEKPHDSKSIIWELTKRAEKLVESISGEDWNDTYPFQATVGWEFVKVEGDIVVLSCKGKEVRLTPNFDLDSRNHNCTTRYWDLVD